MATFRATFGSALSTITATADAAVKTVTTITVGVDMLSNWANLEKAKQEANIKYESKFVELEAKERATVRLSDIKLQSATYVNKSEAHKAAYEAAAAELEAMFTA